MEGDLIELLRIYTAENNNNLQFLKEQETPAADAIYNVYLKKLSYNASRTLDMPLPTEPPKPKRDPKSKTSEEVGVASVNFKTKEFRIIKAGTVERLIDSLFLETGEIDGTYVRIFLATYRTFCSPLTLAEKLAQHHKECENKPKTEAFQKATLSVMSIWLDLYLADFNEPPSYPCLQRLRRFLKQAAPDSDLYNRVNHKFSKFCAEDEPDDGVSLDSVDSDNGYATLGKGKQPTSPELVEVVEFSQLNVRTIAEQLTRIDADLFMKLEAHQCLGSTWNQRGREKANECPTVSNTIEMFNSVIYRVISTILKDIDTKPSKRAKIIEKWILISQELRLLKNFSSLRAIISGLQSSPIFRLRKLWSHVNKEVMEIYTDLSAIFSLDSNQIISRELLMKALLSVMKPMAQQVMARLMEGTAKVSNQHNKTRRKSKDKGKQSLSQFDQQKRRKEFEIVAQIQLFQSAAKMYNIEPHRRFKAWFNSTRVYSEDESYALSCEIEPPTSPEKTTQRSLTKSASASTYSSLAMSLSTMGLNMSTPASPDGVSIGSASSDSAHPVTSQSSISSGDSEVLQPDRRVIRVSLLLKGQSEVNYKSMILSNKDRTPTVIRRVLEKFHIEEEVKPSEYCLIQCSEKNKELKFPSDANVYYAMDTTASQFIFLVRPTALKANHVPKSKSFS